MRMKMKELHVVPLSKKAVEILASCSITLAPGVIFPDCAHRKAISETPKTLRFAVSDIQRQMTTHGFAHGSTL